MRLRHCWIWLLATTSVAVAVWGQSPTDTDACRRAYSDTEDQSLALDYGLCTNRLILDQRRSQGAELHRYGAIRPNGTLYEGVADSWRVIDPGSASVILTHGGKVGSTNYQVPTLILQRPVFSDVRATRDGTSDHRLSSQVCYQYGSRMGFVQTPALDAQRFVYPTYFNYKIENHIPRSYMAEYPPMSGRSWVKTTYGYQPASVDAPERKMTVLRQHINASEALRDYVDHSWGVEDSIESDLLGPLYNGSLNDYNAWSRVRYPAARFPPESYDADTNGWPLILRTPIDAQLNNNSNGDLNHYSRVGYPRMQFSFASHSTLFEEGSSHYNLSSETTSTIGRFNQSPITRPTPRSDFPYIYPEEFIYARHKESRLKNVQLHEGILIAEKRHGLDGPVTDYGMHETINRQLAIIPRIPGNPHIHIPEDTPMPSLAVGTRWRKWDAYTTMTHSPILWTTETSKVGREVRKRWGADRDAWMFRFFDDQDRSQVARTGISLASTDKDTGEVRQLHADIAYPTLRKRMLGMSVPDILAETGVAGPFSPFIYRAHGEDNRYLPWMRNGIQPDFRTLKDQVSLGSYGNAPESQLPLVQCALRLLEWPHGTTSIFTRSPYATKNQADRTQRRRFYARKEFVNINLDTKRIDLNGDVFDTKYFGNRRRYVIRLQNFSDWESFHPAIPSFSVRDHELLIAGDHLVPAEYWKSLPQGVSKARARAEAIEQYSAVDYVLAPELKQWLEEYERHNKGLDTNSQEARGIGLMLPIGTAGEVEYWARQLSSLPANPIVRTGTLLDEMGVFRCVGTSNAPGAIATPIPVDFSDARAQRYLTMADVEGQARCMTLTLKSPVANPDPLLDVAEELQTYDQYVTVICVPIPVWMLAPSESPQERSDVSLNGLPNVAIPSWISMYRIHVFHNRQPFWERKGDLEPHQDFKSLFADNLLNGEYEVNVELYLHNMSFNTSTQAWESNVQPCEGRNFNVAIQPHLTDEQVGALADEEQQKTRISFTKFHMSLDTYERIFHTRINYLYRNTSSISHSAVRTQPFIASQYAIGGQYGTNPDFGSLRGQTAVTVMRELGSGGTYRGVSGEQDVCFYRSFKYLDEDVNPSRYPELYEMDYVRFTYQPRGTQHRDPNRASPSRVIAARNPIGTSHLRLIRRPNVPGKSPHLEDRSTIARNMAAGNNSRIHWVVEGDTHRSVTLGQGLPQFLWPYHEIGLDNEEHYAGLGLGLLARPGHISNDHYPLASAMRHYGGASGVKGIKRADMLDYSRPTPVDEARATIRPGGWWAGGFATEHKHPERDGTPLPHRGIADDIQNLSFPSAPPQDDPQSEPYGLPHGMEAFYHWRRYCGIDQSHALRARAARAKGVAWASQAHLEQPSYFNSAISPAIDDDWSENVGWSLSQDKLNEETRMRYLSRYLDSFKVQDYCNTVRNTGLDRACGIFGYWHSVAETTEGKYRHRFPEEEGGEEE